jgi:hypothetical protein
MNETLRDTLRAIAIGAALVILSSGACVGVAFAARNIMHFMFA